MSRGASGIKTLRRIPPQIYLMFVVVIASVALDQVTKFAAEKHLMVWSHEGDHESYQGRRLPIWSVGDMVDSESNFHLSTNLNYVRNLGAAWGSLSQLPDVVRGPFFFIVTILAVVVIGVYFRSTPPNHRLARWALAFIWNCPDFVAPFSMLPDPRESSARS